MRISDWSSDVCSSDLLKAAANTGPEVGVVHRRYSRAKSSSPRLIASGRGSVVNHQRMPQEAITAKSCPPVAGPRTSIAVIIASMVARVNVIGRLARSVCFFQGPPVSDRKSVVLGQRVSVRVDFGGRRLHKTKHKHKSV